MSDIEPTEAIVPGKRASSEPFGPELSESQPPAPAAREREGLPSTYRMRADPHYVEQLTARRPDRADRDRGEAAKSATTPAVASEPVDVPADGDRERRADRLIGALQEELAGLSSALGMLGHASALTRRLGSDLAQAQIWRAEWLAKTYVLLDGRERPQLRQKTVGSIVERVRQGLTPECRLAGLGLVVTATDWNASVSVDEASLVAGLTGAVLATTGLLSGHDGGTIRVNFDVVGGDLRTIDVVQDEVPPPAGATNKFFDLHWADRPGGALAAIGAQAARAAAHANGGTVSLVPADRRGTAVRFAWSKLH